jgi:hypothetical protein
MREILGSRGDVEDSLHGTLTVGVQNQRNRRAASSLSGADEWVDWIAPGFSSRPRLRFFGVARIGPDLNALTGNPASAESAPVRGTR